VAKYGISGSKTIRSNPAELKTRAKRMKKGRLDGTIPTLSGPDHSQWKGGVSSLNHTCRADRRLYNRWTRAHLIRAKFTCEECGAQGRLQVHHDQETFSEIMRRFAKQHKWTRGLTEAIGFEDPKLDALKKKIAKDVTDYHIKNNVSGVVLCKSCHGRYHPSLNTP
jgi:hypothetical protein